MNMCEKLTHKITNSTIVGEKKGSANVKSEMQQPKTHKTTETEQALRKTDTQRNERQSQQIRPNCVLFFVRCVCVSCLL